MESAHVAQHHEPWNKGKLVGQKAPFKLKEIWAIRVRLQMRGRLRELALFDLGIDSKLRACDLVKLRVHDVCHGDRVAARAIVQQQKTQRPVQFEITPPTREAVEAWIKYARLKSDSYLFPSRVHASSHLGTRQYARIVDGWVEEIGLDPAAYGTHSMRRRHRSSTGGPRTSELFNSCWATASWKVQSDTLASRWTTRWRWPNRPRCEPGRTTGR